MTTIEWKGIDELSLELIRKSGLQFESVANKQLAEMFNRAKSPPFTPFLSGELRLSRRVKKASAGVLSAGEFGYIKDYAPHVEYGHRLKNGGYVSGQNYLHRNLNAQRPIYRLDLVRELKK